MGGEAVLEGREARLPIIVVVFYRLCTSLMT
jgi:hypothetical protein